MFGAFMRGKVFCVKRERRMKEMHRERPVQERNWPSLEFLTSQSLVIDPVKLKWSGLLVLRGISISLLIKLCIELV
jgi:hypothetical protein